MKTRTWTNRVLVSEVNLPDSDYYVSVKLRDGSEVLITGDGLIFHDGSDSVGPETEPEYWLIES